MGKHNGSIDGRKKGGDSERRKRATDNCTTPSHSHYGYTAGRSELPCLDPDPLSECDVVVRGKVQYEYRIGDCTIDWLLVVAASSCLAGSVSRRSLHRLTAMCDWSIRQCFLLQRALVPNAFAVVGFVGGEHDEYTVLYEYEYYNLFRMMTHDA